MDRAGWVPGPWDNEPDKVQFKDSDTGYDCIIRRSPYSGAWCGYVGVPKGHPCFGLDYDAVDVDVDVDVHGGLTFSDSCREEEEETGICHKSEDGEEVWWLGFDCHHYNDLAPSCYSRHPEMFGDGEYRDIKYVTEQTLNLAEQLKYIEKTPNAIRELMSND